MDGQLLPGGLPLPESLPQAGIMLTGLGPSPIGNPRLYIIPILGSQGLGIPTLLCILSLEDGHTLE